MKLEVNSQVSKCELRPVFIGSYTSEVFIGSYTSEVCFYWFIYIRSLLLLVHIHQKSQNIVGTMPLYLAFIFSDTGN